MAVPVLVVSETNGAPAGTVTDNIASVVFASVDSQSGTASLQTNSPVAANTYSFEKWLRMKVTTVSTNSLSAFGVYFTAGNITDGAAGTGNITCKFGVNAAYATPVNTVSTPAATLCSTVTAAPGTSFTAPANTLNAYSGYVTLQANVAAAAAGGNATFPANYVNFVYTYS